MRNADTEGKAPSLHESHDMFVTSGATSKCCFGGTMRVQKPLRHSFGAALFLASLAASSFGQTAPTNDDVASRLVARLDLDHY